MGQKTSNVSEREEVRGGPPTYADTFVHAVDPKGRVTIPSEWRGAGGSGEALFVLPSREGCLKVYPESWVVRQQGRLGERGITDPLRRQMERLFSIAQKAEIDAQGRVMIKEGLRGHAGVGREAVLMGAFDHFEIWDPTRHRSIVGEAVTLEDLAL